jgi:hypothetical protein
MLRQLSGVDHAKLQQQQTWNGLVNKITSSTTIATSAWSLSATTQPSFDSTYPYPCATELLMNKISRTMTTNMPSPQIDGPTEGVWSAEQQFLHCDNSGWTGANSSSWDPFLLYPQC